jgi:DNA-binding CsgD family transcriptional regulator/tetratricopeptide (TPR) repeat protein
MGVAWPLVGRVEELDLISRCVTRRAGPRGVVLAGAAGVGKTRLAREAVHRAAGRGVVTRWVAATESARRLPLGAFAGLVSSTPRDSSEVLRGARDVLLGDHASSVVVGVDDAHLLDDLSAVVVYDLVAHTAAGVVVTVRTRAPAPDLVTALWKEELLDRLEVQPLSEEETGALLEAVVDGPVESASAARLWALTQGNALFLRHIVEGELEAGRLREVGGVWRWWAELEVSPTLAELIDARMGRLPERVSTIADLLALGEPLELSMLVGLAEPGAVEEAETAGIVRLRQSQTGLQVRLAHPLYGEARRGWMGTLRARRLRGQLAEALADADGSDEAVLRRAVLTVESDLTLDPGLLVAAARVASQLADLDLAERLARAAVDAGGGFDARLTLPYMLSWQGRGTEADDELSALATAAGSDVQRTEVAMPRIANLFWTLGRPAEAEQILACALSEVASDDARRCLTAFQAAFHFFLGRPDMAVAAARRALAGGSLPDVPHLVATWGLVGGLGAAGRVDELREAAAAATHARSPHGYLRVGLMHLHVRGLRLAGQLDEIDGLVGTEREARSGVAGPILFWLLGFLGDAALARGRLQEAVRWLREARAKQAGMVAMGWDYLCLISLTQALAMMGNRSAARQALAELGANAHPSFVFVQPDVALARAWVAASEGAVTEARTLAHEAATIAAAHGHVADEVLALHTAVRFGERTVVDRLTELAQQVEGPRGLAAAAHAQALAAADGDGLRDTSLLLEDMGDLVAAADAAAHAASAYRGGGRNASAHAAANRAHELARACQGARTPALIAAAEPLPITDREREIITLAARGLTNQQIADKLVVSVRTVEGHLYRASAKLGINRRTDLADLLGISD